MVGLVKFFYKMLHIKLIVKTPSLPNAKEQSKFMH